LYIYRCLIYMKIIFVFCDTWWWKVWHISKYVYQSLSDHIRVIFLTSPPINEEQLRRKLRYMMVTLEHIEVTHYFHFIFLLHIPASHKVVVPHMMNLWVHWMQCNANRKKQWIMWSICKRTNGALWGDEFKGY